MTGFGSSAGLAGGRAWSWELRSVNARGLDVRLRLPPGWDAHEPALRQTAAAVLQRGAIQAVLSLAVDAGGNIAIRTELLDRLVAVAVELAGRIAGAPPPRAEALLALPGVLRAQTDADPPADSALLEAVRAGFAAALADLHASRQAEGARLAAVLHAQVDTIARLAEAARLAAGEQQVAQRNRLQDSLRSLLAETSAVSEDRLAQELALLASRADVREELDRLDGHVIQARALLTQASGIGRRLDFLMQEFNREANTLCAKSASMALTGLGLDLKASIEQLREQVQNIE